MREHALMERILVPVDGSECSLRAVALAIYLARSSVDSSVHVLGVAAAPIVYGEVAVYQGGARAEQDAAAHGNELVRDAKAAVAASGIRHVVEVLPGEPGAVVARRADELGATLIVMGTHGRSRLGNVVIGSVAMSVVHRVSIPVTLVK